MTDGAARARSIAAELLADSRLPEREARERAALARDLASWRRLAPTLPIEREPRGREPSPRSDEAPLVDVTRSLPSFQHR